MRRRCLGKEYARQVTDEAGYFLHLRGGRVGEDELVLWRIGLEAVDAWTLRATTDASDDKGPFARLLGA
jgi:hypothetical protein